jgi:PKD repeat protein
LEGVKGMRVNPESIILVLIVSLFLLCSACGAVQVSSTTIPVCFIQNNGQIDEQVLYFADAAGYTLYLTADGEVISTTDPVSVVGITYPGSNAVIAVSGENKLPGKANFLIGNEEDWVTNVPTYGSVRYDDLYDGISVVYHGGVGTLKKEFVVEPGADPSVIRMKYAGQEGLALDENGVLLVTTVAGTFFETQPVCYQVIGGGKVPVPGRFILGADNTVTFSIGPYESTLPLVIDPQYDFSTYLGGDQDDRGAGIGIDDFGNVYVVGSTQSTNFPLSNSAVYQEHLNGSWDIFATKFGPIQPEGPIYSTYIGGNRTDMASAMVVNNVTGAVTFTGYTLSYNYPTTTGPAKMNESDVIVTRLAPDGASLQMSRLIGGNKSEEGNSIALAATGHVVVVGSTSSSTDFPVTTADLYSGATDAFVARVASGGALSNCRYLGGSGTDVANGVAIDTANAVYVTGATNSKAFPTTAAAFRNTNQGATDAFITKLNAAGTTITYSTYLGGTQIDVGTAIDVDRDMYPYITGYTESEVSPISLFPIKPLNQAFQKKFNGGTWDAFVTKMEQNLSALNYSTYLGGLYDDKAYGIAVDNNSTAFVVGYTFSENFPTEHPTQPTKGLGYMVPDAFITQLNQTGTGLLFSTYLGGTYYDEGDAIAITDDGINITVTGSTDSINFPVVNATQPALAGFPAVRFTDAFVTKYVKIPPVADFYAIPERACTPANISFFDNSTGNPNSWNWSFGDGNYSNEQNPWHIYVNPGNSIKKYNVTLNVSNVDGSSSFTNYSYIWVCPQPFADFMADNTTGCINLGNNTIQFNVTSKKGGVLAGKFWNWTFGDGNSSGLVNESNVNVTHTYVTLNGTSNFTVTLTYKNACCNNTTVKLEYIDIRDKPNASFFYAVPTSGLIPLQVNFFANATGRPSNWTWTFGAGQGGSNEQNPEHTYSQKGSYNVKLMACNFCGCDNATKNKFIKAGVPNLSFAPDTLVVPTNDTTPIDLYLQAADNGLSGYNLSVYWGDSAHGNITGVDFPFWATNKSHTPLPDYIVGITAVDMLNQVNPGAMNVLLASFDLEGNITTFNSTIDFNVTVNELDDDLGNPIVTNNVPATITVVRLLPFPNKNKPPTDPFEDQVYWDVNGNGKIDFNDVTVFFKNMQWIRDNQYVPFFDYNSNGLIDFDDLIELFHMVPYP